METKLKNNNLSQDQLSHLYFGLGKAYEDIKDFEKSFINYRNGNKILKKVIKFDLSVENNEFTKIKIQKISKSTSN